MIRLLPKEDVFFDFFERVANNVAEAADLLDKLLSDYTDVAEMAKRIHNIEHNGDHLTREAIEKLNRTFITPFDREEIYELICRMDDILDSIDEAVSRLVVYRIEKPTTDARGLAKVLVRCSVVLREIMPMLRNLKRPQEILNRCLEVHSQESEGDRIEQHALAALFDAGNDAIEVIKWKDIYQDLEGATDRCADAANVIESIVIRHS